MAIFKGRKCKVLPGEESYKADGKSILLGTILCGLSVSLLRIKNITQSEMSISDCFSNRTKEIIGWSREMAIELGYDYISTIHILFSDCKSNSIDSVKKFAFKDDFDFNTFYQNQQIGNPSLLHETLPLTLEAEQIIRLSVWLWHRTYVDDEVQPYHIFLAAANLKNSLFHSFLKKQEKLSGDLEKYYIGIGAIEEKNIHHSFFRKLFYR